MVGRRIAIIAALVCLCLGLMPWSALAASTTQAFEPIDVNQEASLTLSCICEGTAFEDVSVRLYQIAEVSADFQYTAVAPFDSYGLTLNGIQTNAEWSKITSTLEAHIIADQIAPVQTAQTNGEGAVFLDALKPGLYLATATPKEQTCRFESALLSLPNLGADGIWQYQVAATPKAEMIPPSAQETEYTILKLWKGDEGKNNRPKSVEVELFRDGVRYKKVTLSQENNWAYRWKVQEEGARWTAVERTVPAGYTMTVEERGDTIVLTNTYTSKKPNEPSKSPDTGDTFNVMFYVVLMILSGSLLVLLAVIGKRNAHEKVQ